MHQLTRQKPIIAIPDAAREITGKQRGRMFVYSDYLSILSQGTEPI